MNDEDDDDALNAMDLSTYLDAMEEEIEDEDLDAIVFELMMDLVGDDEDQFAVLVAAASQDVMGDMPGDWGGSERGKAPNKKRDFHAAYQKVLRQYFSGTDSVYDERDFARSFRMPCPVFNRIKNALIRPGGFEHKFDATHKPGIYPLVRLVACLRKIAYGDADDREDEHLELSKSSLSDTMKQFCRLMISEFGEEYMNRTPTRAERDRISKINATCGFPGLLASWDCKYFIWKNCPVFAAGQYQGSKGMPTVILEAICDADGFFYFHYFGEPGSLNDLNILDKSTILTAALRDDGLEMQTAQASKNDCLVVRQKCNEASFLKILWNTQISF